MPLSALLSVVFRRLCDASYHRRLTPYRAKMRSEGIYAGEAREERIIGIAEHAPCPGAELHRIVDRLEKRLDIEEHPHQA